MRTVDGWVVVADYRRFEIPERIIYGPPTEDLEDLNYQSINTNGIRVFASQPKAVSALIELRESKHNQNALLTALEMEIYDEEEWESSDLTCSRLLVVIAHMSDSLIIFGKYDEKSKVHFEHLASDTSLNGLTPFDNYRQARQVAEAIKDTYREIQIATFNLQLTETY